MMPPSRLQFTPMIQERIEVRLLWLPHGVGLPPPEYMTEGAAGMDLHAAVTEPLWLAPGERALVPCGFALEIPNGFEGQIRPRSGLAVRHGISLLNSPGTIDSDYRGEIKVVLVNLGSEPFTIQRGSRIAQLVISPVAKASFLTVGSLHASDRGDGGFGHTGMASSGMGGIREPGG